MKAAGDLPHGWRSDWSRDHGRPGEPRGPGNFGHRLIETRRRSFEREEKNETQQTLDVFDNLFGGVLACAFCVNAVTQNEVMNEKLLNALRGADLKAVKAELSAGADVNARDADGLTALMYAVAYAGADCVELLLAKGADPNAKSKGDVTALMLAVGQAEKVKLLIEKGAEINAKSKQGHTELGIAAGREGSAEVVKLLLDRGADLSVGTSLGAAARSGDIRVVKLLLEKGADPNDNRSTGGPPPSSAKREAEITKARETTSAPPLLGLPGNICNPKPKQIGGKK